MQEIIHNLLIGLLGILFYLSGLLVWPICALLWRKKGRRTMVSLWIFLGQLGCYIVLISFMIFSQGIFEHSYEWLMLMILANIVFTPAALIAAASDYTKSKPLVKETEL